MCLGKGGIYRYIIKFRLISYTQSKLNSTMFLYILTNVCNCFSDYVVVGSDSGRIVILEYIPSKNTFEKVA